PQVRELELDLLRKRVPFERQMPREELEPGHRRRVEIGAVVADSALERLRREVFEGPYPAVRVVERDLFGRQVCDTEIGDLQRQIFGEKQILRLDIAVYDPGAVHRIEPVEKLAQEPQRELLRERFVTRLEDRAEITALGVLHREIVEVAAR